MEITDKAIDFMERNAAAKKPFYAYVPYTLVHYPTLPSAEFRGSTGHGDWADCLAQMDHNAGRLLDTVDRLGLRDDTIVVFTSDNGADNSTLHKRGSAGPWAGSMFTPMEGSNRVPFIIRWPGRVPSDRESDAIVHEVDTFTTLVRLAGANVPQDRPIDGVDQSDLLLGKSEASAREGFPIFFGEKLYAAKWRNFKLHFVWQVNATDPVQSLVVCPANNWQLIGMIPGMSKPVPALTVTDGQREVLRSLARSQSGAHREVVRAKALLMAADGAANATIAATVSVSRTTVANWRTRFAEDGLVKFGQVREGRGRKPSIPDATIEKIVTLTKQCRPEGETHWSTRTMAGVAGVSKSTVQRVWAELGLKPHRVDTFKVSNDPKFEEKLVDVVGLYLNPPENAIVLCADEKSSVQALDRTQASLPMTKGRGQTMTHDYKRNGTTTLFAALNVLTGMVIGQCLPRHRHQEFLKFLRTIDREVPTGLQVHLILDNYGTHKHADVQHWLDQHPRFHLHFTPTCSSWLNQVERWFRELTDKALRRGAFGSVPDLIAAIQEYIDAHNKDPKPYVWTATAESILAKVARARATLDTVN